MIKPLRLPFVRSFLIHLFHQSIDIVFPIAQVTPFDEMPEFPGPESSGWIAEFEWPQEIARLLEVGSHGDYLVDQILHADDAELAELFFDDGIVGQWNTLLVDFAVTALVDEVADGLDGWVAICDVRFDDFQHLRGGLGEFDEDGIVDLEESEELENLARFGSDLVDTVEIL